jgi:serine/threonine protein kinase
MPAEALPCKTRSVVFYDKCDVYAFGYIMLYMMTPKYTTNLVNRESCLPSISPLLPWNATSSLRSSPYSMPLRTLVTSMLDTDYARRPTITFVCQQLHNMITRCCASCKHYHLPSP